MTKDSIADYSETPSDNTEIEGIGILGANDVLNFDNALRTLMSHLKSGVGNVDNTSDADKPVSTETATAIGANTTAIAAKSGKYNHVLNGDFTVNQDVGTRTPGIGVYGYDQWKGHADGLEQPIELLPAGQYTLAWSGGGNGTFGGTTAVSPILATVTAGTHSVIVPATATKVSLAAGDATGEASPVAYRSYGEELALCQRYYEKQTKNVYAVQYKNTNRMIQPTFLVTKRVVPTITYSSSSTFSFGGAYLGGFWMTIVAAYTVSTVYSITEFTADARI